MRSRCRRSRPPPPGFRRTFRVPPPGAPPAKPAVPNVHLEFRDAKTGLGAGDVRIAAVRDDDGATLYDTTGGEIGSVTVSLAPGTYTIVAGLGLSAYEPMRAPLVVKEGDERTFAKFEMTPRPTIRCAEEWIPQDARVELATSTATLDVTDLARQGGPIAVPSDEDVVLRVEAEGMVRVIPVPREAAKPDAPPVRVGWFPRTPIHVRFAGPDGRPAEGWLSEDAFLYCDRLEPTTTDGHRTPPQSEHVLGTIRSGEVDLLAVPADASLRSQVLHVRVPSEEFARVDLGEVRFAPRGPRRLTLLLPQGALSQEAYVRLVQGRRVRQGDVAADGTFDVDAAPPAEGDFVEASNGDGFAPMRRRLEGSGPWTLRWPSSSIVFRGPAPSAEGETEPEFTYVLDGRLVEPHDETKELLGVEPGPHVVAVSSNSTRTRLFRIVLKDGERRMLDVHLTPLRAKK